MRCEVDICKKNVSSNNNDIIRFILFCKYTVRFLYTERTCLFNSYFIFGCERVWRYQWSNQNLYIDEEQWTQWPKGKVQKDKQLRCSGRVSSSCFTSDTCRVNLVTNPMIRHERGKDQEVFTTSGTCTCFQPEALRCKNWRLLFVHGNLFLIWF